MGWLVKMLSVLFVVGLSSAAFAGAAPDGKSLYLGEKYKCYSCHGKNGEGAAGPSFKGVGKKYSQDEMMKRAAHQCPPTGACSPKDIEALVGYLRTL